jgi:3-methyl-2-oxobutanoate hydroxymethyltransferase
MSRHDEHHKRFTVPELRARKGGEPLVCLTAYDAPTARLLDEHCDLILVGDSVGVVVHGLDATVGVTLEMMILHGQAVMRGSSRALVAVDMPFGSYEASPAQAFANASRIMKETGCQAVKLESGSYAAETIAFLNARGVPVIGHVGVRPQAVHAQGGTKARGRTGAERKAVLADARAADEAGAFAIVIEAVAEDLAREVTAAVACPTIGIGASAACDGQILVTHDLLGLFDWTPRFVRRYADLSSVIEQAVQAYRDDVRARRFPGDAEVYRLKPGD